MQFRLLHQRGWRLLWITVPMLCHTLGVRDAWAEDRRFIPHSVPSRLANAALLGTADPRTSLPMSLTLQLQHPNEVDSLLVELQRPGFANYHRWLTPEEFADRFAPAPEAYAALADWLRHEGFTVSTWPSRMRIDFAGSVTQVERTFQVHMNRYQHRTREVLANADDPFLPSRFAGLVQLARLNTFSLAEPLVRATVSGTIQTTMAPRDMYTAYNMTPLLDAGIDGTGQRIAVIARSDFNLSNVTAFQSQFSALPGRLPKKIFPTTNPGVGAPDGACRGVLNPRQLRDCILNEETEVVLDTQWAGAMAPGALLLVDISAEDVDVSMADVINHHAEAKIITMSFGSCERLDASALQIFNPLYTQAAMQGQTVLVASGDNGADACGDGVSRSVNVLASDPDVTAVGGTALDPGFDANGNATGYVSESVWNDPDGASGGGASTLVLKPPYQSGPGVPPDGFRDQPDVSLLASPRNSGYVVIVENQTTIVGGTSVSAPGWAGIVALLGDALGASGLGALNTALYDLGRKQYAAGGVAVFHDVTDGTTTFDGVNGFAAGIGFDLATGLGSPDVDSLARAFLAVQTKTPTVSPTSSPQPTPTPSAPATFTPTDSPTILTSPTPTPTPSPSPPSPTAPPTPTVPRPPCTGDCAGRSEVTIADLIVGVNIALGSTPLNACPAFDCNGNGQSSIDCLLKAVDAALNGCP